MSELQNIEKDAKDVYTFGKSHIILVIALAISMFFGIYSWDSRRADQADARAAVSAQQAKDADARAAQAIADNQKTQADIVAKEQAADTRVATLQAEIDALTKAIAARDASLVTQKKADASLPPTQLSSRWEGLINAPNGTVSPTPAGSYEVTQSGAVSTVQALDSVSTLTADKADLTKQVADEKTQLNQKDTIISLKDSTIANNASTCTAQLQAKDAELKSANDEMKKVKADATKRNWKYFVFGGVVVEGLKIYLTGKL